MDVQVPTLAKIDTTGVPDSISALTLASCSQGCARNVAPKATRRACFNFGVARAKKRTPCPFGSEPGQSPSI